MATEQKGLKALLVEWDDALLAMREAGENCVPGDRLGLWWLRKPSKRLMEVAGRIADWAAQHGESVPKINKLGAILVDVIKDEVGPNSELQRKTLPKALRRAAGEVDALKAKVVTARAKWTPPPGYVLGSMLVKESVPGRETWRKVKTFAVNSKVDMKKHGQRCWIDRAGFERAWRNRDEATFARMDDLAVRKAACAKGRRQ